MKGTIKSKAKAGLVFLAASTLLLALVACGGALPTPTAATGQAGLPTPTSTASPTPSPTPTSNDERLPSPGDVKATRDCARNPNVGSYDVASTAVAPHVHVTYDIRVSGDDYHLVLTAKKGMPSGEAIGKNGISYEREFGGEWRQSLRYFPLRLLHLPHPIEGDFIVCPNLGLAALTRVGEETLGVTQVERFRLTEGDPVGPVTNVGAPASAADPVDRTWDIWVNSNGELVQTRLIADYVESPDYAAFQVETQSTISGIGEPNVITAPTLPTPTPTPTATP